MWNLLFLLMLELWFFRVIIIIIIIILLLFSVSKFIHIAHLFSVNIAFDIILLMHIFVNIIVCIVSINHINKVSICDLHIAYYIFITILFTCNRLMTLFFTVLLLFITLCACISNVIIGNITINFIVLSFLFFDDCITCKFISFSFYFVKLHYWLSALRLFLIWWLFLVL